MTISFDLYRQANGSLNSRNWAGSAATSGGTAALGWEAPQGFGAGLPLIITTDGTLDFGAVGPNIVMLMDAANYALGVADGSEIQQGAAVSSLTGGGFTIEADSTLPAGKGWQFGEDGQSARVRCSHDPSTRIFESMTYLMPAANIENARALFDSTWQIKPSWNLVNSDNSPNGDFFTTRAGLRAAGSLMRTNWYISANTVPTVYPSMGVLTNPSDANNFPYPEPYTQENLWDQGSADGVTADGLLDAFVTCANGLVAEHTVETGLLLSEDFAGNKIVTQCTYPGYLEGFPIAQNAHMLDCEYYRAVGAGAACRVELSNGSNHFSADANKRTILWSTLWTNNRIELVQRAGWFDLADVAGLNLNIMVADNSQIGSLTL